MFINKDLLDFFGSMTEIKKQKRDIFNTLAGDVDDPVIKQALLDIAVNEQRHVDQLQQSMELINGGPLPSSSERAHTKHLHNGLSKHDTEITAKEINNQHLGVAETESAQIPEDVIESTSTTSIDQTEQSDTPLPQEISGIATVRPAAVATMPEHDIVSKQVTPVVQTIAPIKNVTPSLSGAAVRQHSFSPVLSQRKSGEKQRHIPQLQQTIGVVKKLSHSDLTSHFQTTASQTSYSMNTFKHPLAEVFGFTATDPSVKAQRYRSHRHCPFNNKVPNCTKEQTKNPLGVCSIFHNNKPVITCPVRFREDWIITDDAAAFFFDENARWSSLTDVQLTDAYGKSAGTIDTVLVSYDDNGKISDFGAIEIQAAYISGDARDPFEHYMRDPKNNALMDWTSQSNYPQPDFVSATRESLVPQLIFKGSILNSWHKKMAVFINRSYFETLPNLLPVKKEEAEIAWFIYDLELVVEDEKESYQLRKSEVVYTKFQQVLSALTASYPDNVEHFMKLLPELAGR